MGFWFFKRKKKQEVVETKQEQTVKTQEEKQEQPVEKKPDAKKTPEVKEKKVEVEETQNDDLEEETKNQKKQVSNKYHISQNKDEKSPHFKSWRIRKAGSNKTIKYFETQVEAIKYAEGLAERNDGSIVIHKVDGSIRKQDYTKK